MYPPLFEMLLYAKAWLYTGWQNLTGSKDGPLDKDSVTHQQFITAVQNCANRDAIALLVSRKSNSFTTDVRDARKAGQRAWASMARKCRLSHIVDTHLSEHRVDVPHVSKALGVRLPKNGKEYYEATIPALAEKLFGPDVYTPGLGSLRREIRDLMIVLLHHTWSRQLKTARRISENFDSIAKRVTAKWEGKRVLLLFLSACVV
jgi:hypothetical protein